MNLPWLNDVVAGWDESIGRGRLPHAILLQGPTGVGKRCAAAWLARRHLGLAGVSLPTFPLEVPELADLRWVKPAEDKQAIGIDAMRDLIAELSLTSYTGRGKVAVIEPADAMTPNAANSLLKTLEEPAGNALLILVADRSGRLPATVVSRCQRSDIPLPAVKDSMAWLDAVRRSDHWAAALRLAGNSPLQALVEAERLDEADAIGRDFALLASNEASPIVTAARWMRLDTGFVLDWLSRQVQYLIRRSFGQGPEPGAAVPDSVLQRMDRRKLFCYLDIINRIRSQVAGSYNVQLTMESLLIEWADGLRNCRSDGGSDTMRMNFARYQE